LKAFSTFSPSLTPTIYAKNSEKSNDRMWFFPFCNRYLCDDFVPIISSFRKNEERTAQWSSVAIDEARKEG